MRKLSIALASAGLVVAACQASAVWAADPAPSGLAAYPPDLQKRMLALDAALKPVGGTVKVPGGKVTLNLGDRYQFLNAADAKRVLVDGWGNPPEAGEGVLGMILPAGKHFYDDVWGAVLTFEDTGHVDDKDAASQDYDSVLSSMREGEADNNAARKEAGYPAMTLVGWAQQPTYDSARKTLIWARDLTIEGSGVDTLNYDVRKLGRTGVLSMNMIDSMANLGSVRAAAGDLGSVAEFDQGARYADFDASVDHMADYGLAGLVAAGAGVAVAKKAGLIGILLLVLKKGFVVILAALAAGWAFIKRKLGLGAEPEAEQVYEEERP